MMNGVITTNNAGGILGYGGSQGVSIYILNCYNKGIITSLHGKTAGILGYTFANNVIIKNVYTTQTANIDGGKYSGTILIENGIVINTGIYSTDYMKSMDFINELNNYIKINLSQMQECCQWKQDNKNINEGYPIFEWQ